MRTTDTPAAQRLETAALAWCRAQDLLPRGTTVIAACSGGADSMALLLFLLRGRQALGITVAAAHVDHGIRGAAAHADAAFVADFCRRNGVPFFLYDAMAAGVDIPASPGEDWARRLRYGFLDELAVREKALIATAHTATDQAETLLLRMARGTGVHGLAGIPPRRGPYVRPFLCLTRADTEAYCAALGQAFVTDASNLDTAYARNRVRQQALPALCAVNPEAVAAMGRLAGQLRTLDDWLQAQAQALLDAAGTPQGWQRETLLAAPPPVLEAALCRILAKHGHPQQRYVQLLQTALQTGHGAVQLHRDCALCVRGGFLQERFALPAPPPAAPPQPALPGQYALPGGHRLTLTVLPAQKYEKFIKNGAKCKKGLTCCADYAKISKNALLRTRLPGDRFRPAGGAGHKTLKKYLNERRVPPAQRALLPLLADGHEVLWLWGAGFAEGLAPGPQTAEVLLAECCLDEPPQ